MNKTLNKSKTLGSLNFFCLGMTSLISWNAIVTAFDFFNNKFPVNVYFILQLPCQIAGTITCFVMYFIAKKISLFWRITGGGIILATTTVASAVEATLIPNLTGFWICVVIIAFLGVANVCCQSSSIAFASLFPKENFMSLFWTGSGFSGILICLLRMLFLTIFGDTDKGTNAGTICFFSVAGSWIIFSLILNMAFMRLPYCQWTLKQSGVIQTKRGKSFFASLMGEEKQFQLSEQEEKETTSKKTFSFYWNVCKKIQPHMFLVFVVNIQTYMLFTGIQISKLNIPQIDDAWKLVTLALIFNCYDTTGKYITNISKGSDRVAYIIVAVRFIFFVLDFLLIETSIPFLASKWWAYIVMLLFALSNGYCTGIMMIQGPLKAAEEERETAGFLMTCGFMCGILSGSLSSQAFKNLPANN